MIKKTFLSIIVIFLSWFVLDYILHGILLRSTYESTTIFWRPFNQMNIPLIYFITLVLIVCFVLIYALLIEPKSIISGIKYGVLFGLVTGISSGFGTYVHMPIPLILAWGWFFGGLTKAIIAGLIVGKLIKSKKLIK